MSEQGGHLWRKRKWLYAGNQPDGDVRSGGWSEAAVKVVGTTKVLFGAAGIARSLSGRRRFSKQMKEHVISGSFTPAWTHLMLYKFILRFPRYCVTGDLSQKGIIRLFSFFFNFTPDISSYQSDNFLTHTQTKGTSSRDLFHCCCIARNWENMNNNKEETARQSCDLSVADLFFCKFTAETS